MQHSEWAKPTTEEMKELEYTQLEKAAGGNNKKDEITYVPIDGGLYFVVIAVLIFGLWKQSRISQRYTSES